jgi:endonuclease YncB( thermonuclease family)
MANKALYISNQGFKIGNGKLGKWGAGTGSVKQVVHDGDTVSTLFDKNLSVRFLGIDTPEVSIPLPADPNNFEAIGGAKWDAFFTSGDWKTGLTPEPNLMAYLNGLIGNGAGIAKNHADHAKKSTKALEKIIQDDVTLSGKADKDFDFFMAYGFDILDSFARLLCYLNSDVSNYANPDDADAIKKKSYNERQLENGAALPYFIFPNIQPFINIKPFSQATIAPNNFWIMITNAWKLKQARNFVKQARQNKLGIYDAANPLILAPHELRFIGRQTPPDRFVVDLSQPFTNQLLRPEKYFTILNNEDRLYIPREFAPMFEKYGWVIV